MSHERNKGNKSDRKPKTKGKKHGGLPPHLQQKQEQDSIREIQSYVNNVAKRQSDTKSDSK